MEKILQVCGQAWFLPAIVLVFVAASAAIIYCAVVFDFPCRRKKESVTLSKKTVGSCGDSWFDAIFRINS